MHFQNSNAVKLNICNLWCIGPQTALILDSESQLFYFLLTLGPNTHLLDINIPHDPMNFTNRTRTRRNVALSGGLYRTDFTAAYYFTIFNADAISLDLTSLVLSNDLSFNDTILKYTFILTI